MTIAVTDDRSTEGTLSAEHGPVAALALTADDLPNLSWENDEASGTRFAVIEVDQHQFALESEDDAPDKQITVYGVAGEPLDAFLQELSVDVGDVLDRIDRRTAQPPSDLEETVRRELEQVQVRASEIEAQFVKAMFRNAQLEEERKQAAAVLVAAGGEELTERQRQTLSLVLSGMTADEIAQVLEISRETVLRHKRRALAHGAGRRVVRGAETLTARERQVAVLAAEGISDREIAKELAVTTKTVAWHLKNTLLKLGVNSRADLPKALKAA